MGAFLRKYSFCSSWQIEAEFIDWGAGQRKTSFCSSWQKEDEEELDQERLRSAQTDRSKTNSPMEKLGKERFRSAQADRRKMNSVVENLGKYSSSQADRRKTNSLMEELDQERLRCAQADRRKLNSWRGTGPRKTSFCWSWQKEAGFTDGGAGQRKTSFCSSRQKEAEFTDGSFRSSCKVHRKNEDREIMPAKWLKPPLTLKQFAFSPAPLHGAQRTGVAVSGSGNRLSDSATPVATCSWYPSIAHRWSHQAAWRLLLLLLLTHPL